MPLSAPYAMVSASAFCAIHAKCVVLSCIVYPSVPPLLHKRVESLHRRSFLDYYDYVSEKLNLMIGEQLVQVLMVRLYFSSLVVVCTVFIVLRVG